MTSNKYIYLSREGMNEPPGHRLDDKITSRPRKRIKTETNDERLTREHEERMSYGNSIHLLKEEKERVKQRIIDQHERYE